MRWQRHYTRFCKQSALFCDLKWPDFYNTNTPNMRGRHGVERRRRAGVLERGHRRHDDASTTGIELGRRIWNLDNAIWTLQGRHRDMVHFAPYIYETQVREGRAVPVLHVAVPRRGAASGSTPTSWGAASTRRKFDEWKTIFYGLEGWDAKTGWPTRRTLEGLGLGHVADTLDKAGRLGRERA